MNYLKSYRKYINKEFIKSLLVDPANLNFVSILILFAEFILNIFIIQNVRYTEIDWKAYMQECEGFLNGTTNYSLLKGDTGPLVYPAGFVYIYTILYFITSKGQNIRLAQYIFACVYLIQMYLVLRLYSKTRKVPPYVLILCTFTSYRVHSIYVLRLFNDPIAILFMYLALNFYMDQRWYLGSIFFSLGVSVKMNILLFAPAIFLFYIVNLGWIKTIYQICICGFVQLLLGIPFLLTYPIEYIKGSFNLGRIFEHKWTVNYRFLSQNIFENRIFHIGLLVLHIFILLIIASPSYEYFKSYCRLRTLESQLQPQIDRENERINLENSNKKQKKFLNKQQKLSNKSIESETNIEFKKHSVHFEKAVQLALLPIFLCNFIGIICARSLHYQFYVWYFHSLPYLCWSTDFSFGIRFLLLGLLEFCWNTYPSTNISSVLLHICHFILLIGVIKKLFKSYTFSKQIINNNCKTN